MSTQSATQYIQAMAALREGAIGARLRRRTSRLPMHSMQSSVDQGQLLGVLARTVGARRAIEVGIFTGYSTMCIARHLPKDGLLVACDISEEWTSIGKRFWKEAGVAGKISLRLGPAAKTLESLIKAGESGTYDMAFIDADKEGYSGYYEQCLKLIRPGGIILIDNIFWGGKALENKPKDHSAAAVRAVTAQIFADQRVDPALIPIRDGVLLACKR